MSEEAKPRAEGEASPPAASQRSLVDIVRVADPLSIGALITAIVAGVVGIIQTGFMWMARNDEVEGALRAQQLRACVEYRLAGENAIARAQLLAEENGVRADDPEFHGYILDYQAKISQLYYLLPTDRAGTAVDDASRASADSYAAYVNGDNAELDTLSGNEGIWIASHDQLIDVCESVIRDLRDR